ncbi:hypothetical protein ID866_5933 [Astraeus odoratus]|nr:hypothetical protein ID866_5933 [Astraeus odoratus]
MKPNARDAKLADITFEDGRNIIAKYVIAADGAHSTIRSIAGIGFKDSKGGLGDNSTTLAQLAQADVTFDVGNVDEFGFRSVMSPNSIFLCVPLPSTFNEYLASETGKSIQRTIYRVVCGVPIEEGPVPDELSKEYMQALTNKFGPLGLSSDPAVNPSGKPICIQEVVWGSRFRTHSAIADTFFTRLSTGDLSDSQGAAIILVGDAAHIHSPAGGQGMNLGLRDAVFLVEALTKHIRAAEEKPLSEADAILTSFVAERHAQALEVISFTKSILAIVGAKDEVVAWWLPINKLTLRDWFVWLLGPTGLAVALSLIHHGFNDFVIVDALERGENLSRALAVHAATLEALDTVGCGDEMVLNGTKLSEVNVGPRTSALVAVQFDYLKPYTRHPYVLVIPQTFTEHILGKKLVSFGVTVHRPYRVVGMKPNAKDTSLADVTFEGGHVITARYVIGADGAHSVVRSIGGIRFIDPESGIDDSSTTLTQLALADVTFDSGDFDDLGFRGVTSPDSFLLCLPLPTTFNDYLANEVGRSFDDRICRVACGVPVEEPEIPSTPSKEYIQQLIDRFGPFTLSSDPTVNPSGMPVHIKDVVWSSRARTSSAIADTFFTRLPSDDPSGSPGAAIILIGDAAHIHSPAGGQGMNLGLRDAIFLGEVFVRHIKATESKPLPEADAILSTFLAQRRALALEVITLTKRLLLFGGAKDEKVAWWLPISKVTLRNMFLWTISKVGFIQKRVAWNVSGLGRR